VRFILFLWWLFSNSGAVRGEPDERSHYIFAMGKHPLRQRVCKYCKRTYWAFTATNCYCGHFKCFVASKTSEGVNADK